MATDTALLLMLLALLAMIALGVHIAIALGIASIVGIYLVLGSWTPALSMLSSGAFEVLRDYVFAIIPLFVLMGDFIARSGAAADVFKLVNRLLRRLPGRLGVATVAGNAIFAAVTGASLASAAAFTRIAYPEMVRFGYHRTNAVGVIAGSACLGMLIPPSVLLIIWGILTEDSIGKLFVAGILPGILLALLFAAYVIGSAVVRPERWGGPNPGATDLGELERLTPKETVGALGILALIVLVLGGIWGGVFTPTEAAGVGAVGALILAIVKGMRLRDILIVIYEAGRTSAPIMILLIVAQLYARLLALGGVIGMVQGFLTGVFADPAGLLFIMVLIWLVLGMLLDSASIILLTVPIFAPIAWAAGWEPYAFAIVGILAIEAGLLTPPFGLLVYAVKNFMEDKAVTLGHIFAGSIPYWIIILIAMVLVAAFPALGEWLPSLM